MSASEIRLLQTSFFRFEYDGTHMPTVTDIDLPSQEYEPITHDNGSKSPMTESQGRILFGDLTVQRDVHKGMSTKFYDEFEKAQTTGDTSTIKKPITVYVKDQEDKTIWTLKFAGTWVKRYDPPTLASQTSDTATETFTFSVDYMESE
jgi:phage tail-like protein